MHLFLGYLAAVGGVTAGTQVVRGVVRGTVKLVTGDARGAIAEVAGGLAAPLFSACNQACALGADVWRSGAALLPEPKKGSDKAVQQSSGRTARRRIGTPPASPSPVMNGAAA